MYIHLFLNKVIRLIFRTRMQTGIVERIFRKLFENGNMRIRCIGYPELSIHFLHVNSLHSALPY